MLFLYILCALAGLIMVVGSLLLLWQGRILLDAKGEAHTEIDLPLGIRLKTQFPVLVMFLFGAFMLFVPISYDSRLCPNLLFHKEKPLKMVGLSGKVTSPIPVKVFAIVAEQEAEGDRAVNLRVPYVENRPYRIRYECPSGDFLKEEQVEVVMSGAEPYPFKGYQGDATPCQKSVLAGQKESPEVAGGFK